MYFIYFNSFFQINSYVFLFFIKVVENFVFGEMILDLYVGVGMFGVWLVKRRFQVEGIEFNLFVVEIVNKNVEINNVDVIFKVGRVEEILIGKYDMVVVDFLRKGLKEVVEIFVRSEIGKVVYVFCNLKVFKLDYENYLKKVYIIEDVVLIDMFFYMLYVEVVISLKRKY